MCRTNISSRSGQPWFQHRFISANFLHAFIRINFELKRFGPSPISNHHIWKVFQSSELMRVFVVCNRTAENLNLFHFILPPNTTLRNLVSAKSNPNHAPLLYHDSPFSINHLKNHFMKLYIKLSAVRNETPFCVHMLSCIWNKRFSIFNTRQ